MVPSQVRRHGFPEKKSIFAYQHFYELKVCGFSILSPSIMLPKDTYTSFQQIVDTCCCSSFHGQTHDFENKGLAPTF